MNNPKKFKIATFNLLNLTTPNEPYYDKHYTQEEFDKKKHWIAHQLEKLEADVIGFQELFNKEALLEVIKDLPEYKNANLIMSARKGESPAVAILSKYPIKSYTVYTDFPDQMEIEGSTIALKEFSRPVLKAEVEISKSLTISFFVAHLKSKRPSISPDKDCQDPLEIAKGEAKSLLLRSIEACALRTILMETLENRDKPVVVLGDLNDTPTSVTTQIITGQMPPRYWSMEQKKKVWDTLLYNVKDIQARQSTEDVYYTHIHNGHYESLDHILVSQELVKENPDRVGRVIYAKTFADHIEDKTLTGDRVNYWESDHAQVVVTIELEKF